MPAGEKRKEKRAFGEKLRALRNKRALSQKDLSTETGLSQSWLSRIEKGEARPTRDVLVRLAHFFGVSLEELVKGTKMEAVLDQPRFAQLYAYCPNVDCPATKYKFWNEAAGDDVLYTVEELWERYAQHNHGYIVDDDGDWDAPDADLTPRELLEKYKGAEVEYRWVTLDENTKFCEHCGTTLRNTCPHCDVPLKMRNQKFCHACGRRLNRPMQEDSEDQK